MEGPIAVQGQALRLRRKALATGVRANMATRWQPRREKMRVGTVKLTVSEISMTCVISGVNSSELRL